MAKKSVVDVSVQQVTPTGFMLDAVEFFKAAEMLLNAQRIPSLPIFFLLGRSVELSLKAFLLHSGLGISKLASKEVFGHSLGNLWAESVKRDLNQQVQFGTVEEGVIELLSKEYSGPGTRLTYRVTGGMYLLPRIDVTEDVARRLIDGVEKLVASR